MRILHTADWHLGKMFYGEYLTEDQAYILTEQLLPLIADEGIDAVVLAGDVYDRSLPPSEAVELFDEISTKITTELKRPLFIISGNHDSAARLSFASRLLDRQGMHIAGELHKLGEPIVLEDAAGPVAFVALPFAEPAIVRHFLQDDSISDHQSALQALRDRQISHISPAMRTICIAHAFVAGGVVSDSERPISIGGSDYVDAALFADFSYTALGHLHGPQRVAQDTIRYSGSLLKYSFSEARQQKGAVLVDLDGQGLAVPQFIPFAPRRDVRILEGYFDEIMANEDARTEDFILARLKDRQPILDGMAKLRRKYPSAMALETPFRNADETRQDRSFDVRHSTEQQLFESFAAAMRVDEALNDKERNCVQELWNRLEQEEGDRS